jgi:hypothetical protein
MQLDEIQYHFFMAAYFAANSAIIAAAPAFFATPAISVLNLAD